MTPPASSAKPRADGDARAQPATRTAVVALGGNALSPAGERSTIHDQFRHTRESLGPVVDLVLDGWNAVVVHGNGPQVGDALVRNEVARAEVSPLPLGVLVAATAGWIGYMIQQSLANALRRQPLEADAGRLRPVVMARHAVLRERRHLLRCVGGVGLFRCIRRADLKVGPYWASLCGGRNGNRRLRRREHGGQ